MRTDSRRLLLDTNVWVAYYLNKPGLAAQDASELIGTSLANGVELFYAPTALKDAFYLIPRELRRAEMEDGLGTNPAARRAATWGCIQHMREIATPAPLTGIECDLAGMLRSMHPDLEDNLVVACAETCRADYLVTYDKQLLGAFSPSCITPAQALSAIAVWEAGR